jgi:hypothetical protein
VLISVEEISSAGSPGIRFQPKNAILAARDRCSLQATRPGVINLQIGERIHGACDCGGKARPRPERLCHRAVITELIGSWEVVSASAGNRAKTSGSFIKYVELETCWFRLKNSGFR